MNRSTPYFEEVEAIPTPRFDLDAILSIHRDPGGFIGFARKPRETDPDFARFDKEGRPRAWTHLFSIRASELRSMFPAVAHWLVSDSYMTVNSYYRPAPYANKLTGLPDVWRGEEKLRSLTACYADLDCGRPEDPTPGASLDWLEAFTRAEAAMDTGHLPQASIVARSGRGVYLLWLLQDEKDRTKLPHAWPETRAFYKQLNRKLIARIKEYQLPADLKCHDAARVLRVPGSIHNKAQRRVKYWIRADERKRGFVYTLGELADFLGVPTTENTLPERTRRLALPAQYRQTKQLGKAPRRILGKTKLNAKRAQDLATIEAWRGGFLKRGVKYPDGSTSPGRRFILSLYVFFLHNSGEDQNSALEALRKMAANCKPFYGSDGALEDPPIETIIEAEYKTGAKPRRWNNETLCALLGITAAIARDLELKTIKPRELAEEERANRPTHEQVKELRLAFAREIYEQNHSLTARQLAKLYEEQGFPGANRETANQDLTAIRGKRRTRRQLDNSATML